MGLLIQSLRVCGRTGLCSRPIPVLRRPRAAPGVAGGRGGCRDRRQGSASARRLSSRSAPQPPSFRRFLRFQGHSFALRGKRSWFRGSARPAASPCPWRLLQTLPEESEGARGSGLTPSAQTESPGTGLQLPNSPGHRRGSPGTRAGCAGTSRRDGWAKRFLLLTLRQEGTTPATFRDLSGG